MTNLLCVSLLAVSLHAQDPLGIGMQSPTGWVAGAPRRAPVRASGVAVAAALLMAAAASTMRRP